MEIQTKIGTPQAVGQQIRDRLKAEGLLRAYRMGDLEVRLQGWTRQGPLYGVRKPEVVEAA